MASGCGTTAMRNDIYEAIEAEAADMRRKADESNRERAKLYSQGSCHIRRVNTDVYRPAWAEIHTDVTPMFPVFDRQLATHASIFEFSQRQIQLVVNVTARGTLYIAAFKPFPKGYETSWECANCGGVSKPITSSAGVHDFGRYQCKRCHYIMFVEPYVD